MPTTILDGESYPQALARRHAEEAATDARLIESATANQGHSMLYHPELNEKPAARLFYTNHVYGGTYSVNWRASEDEKARATLKALRIRAKYGKEPEREVPGDWSFATRLGGPVFHILVTPGAHRKLMDGDLCACLALLD